MKQPCVRRDGDTHEVSPALGNRSVMFISEGMLTRKVVKAWLCPHNAVEDWQNWRALQSETGIYLMGEGKTLNAQKENVRTKRAQSDDNYFSTAVARLGPCRKGNNAGTLSDGHPMELNKV